MIKKKICKKCKAILDEDKCRIGDNNCPVFKNSEFSTQANGRVFISDPENSFIAKRMQITVKGEYAIKVK